MRKNIRPDKPVYSENMPARYLSAFALLLLMMAFPGCKKFIEVAPPKTELAVSEVFSDNNVATSAVTSIYAQMQSMTTIIQYTGLSSDEFTNYGADKYDNLYKNALTESTGTDIQLWTNAYNYIYQANAVLEGLQHSSAVTTAVKNQLSGEATFIRAFWFFYLTTLYGDIPIIKTTDYRVIPTLPGSPQKDVYQQIIDDLTAAQALLADHYIDSKNAPSDERVRPTKWAATALLARAYLFNKDYLNAELQSSKIINNTELFNLPQDLNEVFLKNSTETIWQLMPPPDNFHTDEGSRFILTDIPDPTSGVALSPQVLDAFEQGDKRKDSWVDSVVTPGSTYYYPFKYKIKDGQDEQKEYSMVLRLAEQLLIRAEARIQQNKLKPGADDIDALRARAGLTPTKAATKEALIKAIMHERQAELFTEGHRWLDLKSHNLVDKVMLTITPEKGGGPWQSYQQLYPIPHSDIQMSQHLKQNPGY
ncbi:RagB/SusD family nutrient uptake outer membrane protein [Chitinophaga sp. 22321]|uniref:RagB/SusD family nutrient uptake outer membrane protein n=1 Tax=Chitinophaga hostae TaxID=2831022 RepID=A0ABS5JA15_9BACT|nr:RagB/SusD family nutrient uptake outer membrane protein [Chitinophaga hostae]MBS0032049.1 RagB/SusD family nutrient uptake outer membrane protein [Chitinophaga hostae]